MKEKTIYALGFFDGVHLGHQALLKSCRALAQEHGCKAGVVTFAAHPDALVAGKTPLLINALQDREEMLLGHWVSHIMVLSFDENLRNMPWQDFLEDLLQKGAAGFVCGSDFHFGAGGSGTAKELAAFCKNRQLPHAVVPQQVLDGVRISSTYIRELIEAGEMEQAVAFLGHPHILSGTVVSGRKLGRTIGIPTANLEFPAELVLPRPGVYACKAEVAGKKYLAVTNIGSRPTVEGHHITVEPWILDFEGDLYGKELTLEFYRFLRPEQKFASLGELKTEIEKNAVQVRNFFKN